MRSFLSRSSRLFLSYSCCFMSCYLSFYEVWLISSSCCYMAWMRRLLSAVTSLRSSFRLYFSTKALARPCSASDSLEANISLTLLVMHIMSLVPLSCFLSLLVYAYFSSSMSFCLSASSFFLSSVSSSACFSSNSCACLSFSTYAFSEDCL